ncbi:uncharacterized protein LOC127848389 isoform X1 [Dreissena polymorpha]|nr:uncharacterized protein LOC127848389 isoform X1 [Dreissena polymorpha]
MNLSVWISILLGFAIFCSVCEGRRGRGGGSRIGSRGGFGSSSYRSYQSGSSSSTRVRVRYSGPSFTRGSWQTAAAIGTVYGLSSYRQRSLYYRYPDREPTICYNEVNLKNSTFGYFVCPETNMTDSFDKCCGDPNEQRCCDPMVYTTERKQVNIVVIVVGVIVGCVVVAVIIYIVIVRRRRAARQGQVIQKQQSNVEGSIPLNPYTNQTQHPAGPGGFMGTPSVPGFGEGNGIAHGQNYDYGANSQPGYPAYPPPNKPEGFEDMGKSALPEGEVSGPAPFQPYSYPPPPPGASYQPPTMGIGYDQQGVNPQYPNAPPPPYSG